MKVIFIKPYLIESKSSDAMEPIVFAVLASLTPKNVKLILFDERIEKIDYNETADLVAITVDTYSAKHAYEISKKFRSKGIKVIMGGFHPTMLPEETSKHCDSIALGDAEGIWEKIIEDAKSKKLKKIYKNSQFKFPNEFLPDRSIFNKKKYAPISLIQFGRGCKYSCDFCSVSAFYKKKFFHRGIDSVISEVKSVKHKLLFFTDDNILSDRESAKILLNRLIPLKKKWACQVSIDAAFDYEILNLMRKSGCIAVIIGFESLDYKNLTMMNKNHNLKLGEYSEAVKNLKRMGIMLYATFVFGYDNDNINSFDSIAEFAIKSKFYLANFNPLTPMPGTRLLKKLTEEKRLIYNKWWLSDNYQYGHAAFKPIGMTAQQLTEGCFKARKKFYSYPSILWRIFSKKSNMKNYFNAGVYLLSNYVSRKEIHQKQEVMFLLIRGIHQYLTHQKVTVGVI